MFTVFKILTAAAVAFVLWTNFADAAELQGPGPFLIINGKNVVVGVVVGDVAIPLEGVVGSGTPPPFVSEEDLIPFGTLDNPSTKRLQLERITPDRWEEPTCPRGVKVLRLGKWEC